MNRRNRTLIVLLVAVGLASAATFFVYRAIVRIPVRQVEVASVYVAVAAENLSLGTRLTKDNVKIVGWPSPSPVQGSFATADALVGRGLIQPVHANEPLTETKLAPIEAGAGLPPSIPPGMRALSVRVNDVIGVAGFTTPGTRVDVLVTLNRGDVSMSRAVVSNVQVLTAGTLFDQEQSKDGKAIPSTVVTLMVTPDDAERIVLAQNSGSIMLVLRNPLDVVPTDTKGVRLTSLMGAPDGPPQVKVQNGQARVVPKKPVIAETLPEAAKFYSVQVYRAAKPTEEVVK
jgi:pilus assembly protein CpaB